MGDPLCSGLAQDGGLLREYQPKLGQQAADATCSVRTTRRTGSLRVSSHGKGLLSMGYWPNQALHRTALPLVGWGR